MSDAEARARPKMTIPASVRRSLRRIPENEATTSAADCGADSAAGQEHAVSAHAGVNHSGSIRGDHRLIAHANHPEEGHEHELGKQPTVVTQVAQTAQDDADAERFAMMGAWSMNQLDREHGGDSGDEADAVERKTAGCTEEREANAGERRAENPRGVEETGVERNRVRQNFGADQLKEEDLAAGYLEGDADSRESQNQRHLPDMHDLKTDQGRQGECQRHLAHSMIRTILSGGTRSARAPAYRPTRMPGKSDAISTTPSMNSDRVCSKTSQRTAAAWSQLPTRLMPCPI